MSPLLFQPEKIDSDAVIVIIDVLRATTAFCATFESGALTVIPVVDLDDLRIFKERGFLTAAERDGKKVDFANFGNSPVKFLQANLHGKEIAYSTTNGTRAVEKARSFHTIVAGAFVNLNALCNWISTKQNDVMILCSGWKNEFSLEDTLCAGALIEALETNGLFHHSGDAAKASLQLWKSAKHNLKTAVGEAEHHIRLEKLGLLEDLEYCFSLNCSQVIPLWNGSGFINGTNKSNV